MLTSWVVVILRGDYSVPSVVGPFTTEHEAIKLATIIEPFVEGSVKLVKMEAPPIVAK